MFLIRSHTPKAAALNAIAPLPDTRTKRHERRLALCGRLADLGMELAEAAQRGALRDLQPRPERSPPPPGAWMPPAPPDIHHASLTECFAAASRCVRQAILLEARLDEAAAPQPAAAPSAAVRPHPPSRGQRQGDGTGLHYEALEDDLAAEDRATADALAGIAQRLATAAAEPALASQPAATPPAAHPTRPGRPNPPCAPNRPPPKPPRLRPPQPKPG